MKIGICVLFMLGSAGGQRLLALAPLGGDNYALSSFSPNGTLSPLGPPLRISPAWGVSTFDHAAGVYYTVDVTSGEVIGISASTGSIVSRTPLPAVIAFFGAGVFISWAPDLRNGLLAFIGDAANGSHVVGALDPRTGAFNVSAVFSTPGDRDDVVGTAAYVPGAHLFVFHVMVAGGALPEDSYVNFAVNLVTGEVRNATDPNGEPGPSIQETRGYYGGDGLVYGMGYLQCMPPPGGAATPPCQAYAFNRTVTALEPQTLALTVRGIVAGFGVELGSISAVADSAPGGSVFWLGFRAPFVPGRDVPIYLVQNALQDAALLSQSAPVCLMGADVTGAGAPPPRRRGLQTHPNCPWSMEWEPASRLASGAAQ